MATGFLVGTPATNIDLTGPMFLSLIVQARYLHVDLQLHDFSSVKSGKSGLERHPVMYKNLSWKQNNGKPFVIEYTSLKALQCQSCIAMLDY